MCISSSGVLDLYRACKRYNPAANGLHGSSRSAEQSARYDAWRANTLSNKRHTELLERYLSRTWRLRRHRACYRSNYQSTFPFVNCFLVRTSFVLEVAKFQLARLAFRQPLSELVFPLPSVTMGFRNTHQSLLFARFPAGQSRCHRDLTTR